MATSEDLARLAEFRLQIDAIDEQLLTVLAQRAALVAQAWRLKENTGMPQRNAEREREILARMAAHGEALGLDPQAVAAVFQQVIGVARRP